MTINLESVLLLKFCKKTKMFKRNIKINVLLLFLGMVAPYRNTLEATVVLCCVTAAAAWRRTNSECSVKNVR